MRAAGKGFAVLKRNRAIDCFLMRRLIVSIRDLSIPRCVVHSPSLSPTYNTCGFLLPYSNKNTCFAASLHPHRHRCTHNLNESKCLQLCCLLLDPPRDRGNQVSGERFYATVRSERCRLHRRFVHLYRTPPPWTTLHRRRMTTLHTSSSPTHVRLQNRAVA